MPSRRPAVAPLDQPVGVEDEGRARRDVDCRLGAARAGQPDRGRQALVEREHLAARQAEQRRRVAGAGVGDAGRRRPSTSQRRYAQVAMSAMWSPRTISSARVRTARRRRAVPRVRAQQRAQLAHRRGGAQVVARRRRRPRARSRRRAAAARRTSRRPPRRAGSRRRTAAAMSSPGIVGDLGQQAVLQGQRGVALGEEEPHVVEREAGAAAEVGGGDDGVGAEAADVAWTRHRTPITRSRARSGTTRALPRPSRRSSGELRGRGPVGQCPRRRSRYGAATKPGVLASASAILRRPRQPARRPGWPARGRARGRSGRRATRCTCSNRPRSSVTAT